MGAKEQRKRRVRGERANVLKNTCRGKMINALINSTAWSKHLIAACITSDPSFLEASDAAIVVKKHIRKKKTKTEKYQLFTAFFVSHVHAMTN